LTWLWRLFVETSVLQLTENASSPAAKYGNKPFSRPAILLYEQNSLLSYSRTVFWVQNSLPMG